MSEEWCREQLANLQIKDRRLNTLTEIRNHLTKLPANEVAVTSNFLTLPEIFDCVEEIPGSNEQTNLACDILSICMTNLELCQTENQYYLERSIQHTNVDVKLLGLNEIERIIKQTPNATFNSNILISLIKCLECPSTHVGAAVVKILSIIISKSLHDQSIKANLEKTLTCSDLTRCRIYEISINIAKESTDLMAKVEFVIDQLITDLDSTDILLQLNVLDLLSDLALSDHGLLYLENKGVFAKITKNVQTLEVNPLKNLLVPGYMKFFGNIASTQPAKIIQGFPHMINSLFDCILDSDCSILPVAFDTLGQLGRTADGKILLHEHYAPKLRETLNEIGKSIHNLTTKLQTRALNCLEILFEINVHESNNQVSSITKSWFRWLTGTNGLAFLMDFCRNPFPEIKIAALTLLKSICTHKWGQRALDETAGFIEFLLDRRIEFDKDAIQEKYGVIKLLADSNVFDATTIMQLKKYVSEGAFYVVGIMEVAVDAPGL